MAAATLVIATKKSMASREGIFCTYVALANVMDNSGVQDIFDIDVTGVERLAVHLTVATNALAAFQIKAITNPDDTVFVTLASASGDFTAPKGFLIGASGDITLAAVAATHWFYMFVAGLSRIRLSANSSAAGGSSLALYAAAA